MSGALLIQNPDGANEQARAVLEMVRYHLGDGIESSWNDDLQRYVAEPRFARFDNCREQGYFIFMRDTAYKAQINIAFAEHRSSDQVIVYSFEKITFNAPVLADIPDDAWLYEHAQSFNCGQIDEAARFIVQKLLEFWDKVTTKEPVEAAATTAAVCTCSSKPFVPDMSCPAHADFYGVDEPQEEEA